MGDEYRVRKFSEEDAFAVSELIARTLVERDRPFRRAQNCCHVPEYSARAHLPILLPISSPPDAAHEYG